MFIKYFTDNQKQSAEVIKRINHKIDVVDTSSLKKRTNPNGKINHQ